MEDDKRCTKFPQSSDLSSAFPESSIQYPLLNDTRRLQKRIKPPRLPVSVKRTADDLPDNSKRRSNFTQECSPWGKYQKLQQACTKGKTCLAYEKACPSTIVAIKECSTDKSAIDRLFKTSHTNLVNLLSLFVDAESVSLVYEKMDVNLDQLLSTVKLKEPQIAFLCKEILHGLAYIHEELHVHHGNVKSSNIFLTLNGQVKIGDIAVSLLQNVTEDNLEDVKSIGRIVKEILEPGDSKKNPSSVSLRNTDNGSDNIRTFISATQTTNLRNLLNAALDVSHL